MDRNLGARRVATAVDDVFSYGNHYQWGRPADGHEISVWNGTTHTAGRGLNNSTTTLATTDAPVNGDFIINTTAPYDWRSDNNSNRWATVPQGPCPTGYHVPTNAEWDIADAVSGWGNQVDVYQSTLKLPSSGYRNRNTAVLSLQGTRGHYWSSTVSGTTSRNMGFESTIALTNTNHRAHGFNVRCLKD